MKGLKCLKKFVFCLAIFVIGFLVNFVDTNALEFGTAYSLTVQSASGTTTSGAPSPTVSIAGGLTTLDFSGGYSNTINLNLGSSIPARSLISIQYNVVMNGQYTTAFDGLTCRGTCVVLANDVSVDDDVAVGHMLIYNSSTISTIELGAIYHRNSSVIYHFMGPISYVLVPASSGGGSSVDLTTVENYLHSIDSNDLISAQRLLLILNALNSLSSSTSISQQQVVDSISETNEFLEQQQEQDQEDRDNIEQQSSDIDSDASDSQQDAENTGTTLLAAFSSFVTSITSASPSNCNLDMDLGNLDLGVVNLCQLSPPAGFSTLASIFLILFCVPLSIATARKVISLFRSFQG